MKYFLAIDLGATSGRHVVGYFEDGKIKLEEIYRFLTGMDNDPVHDKVWNIKRIFSEIKKGIKIAFQKYQNIESLSIDTWGVDYVLMNGEEEIEPIYAYRNKRLNAAYKEVEKKITFDELYKITGIQFAPFNTIYQLYDDLLNSRLDNASDYLMLPSYFTYKLTGIKTHEYTNETTGALIDINTNDYAFSAIDKLGLPRRLFKNISLPGTIIGKLSNDLQKELGGNTNVILCATHDTASAFESVDVSDDSIILSSGTWSLLGIKAKSPIVNQKSLNANYTNEGGCGYIRFLKNIMGMWIVNEIKKEEDISFEELLEKLPSCSYRRLFDVNDQSLVAPSNMKEAVLNLLKEQPPKTIIELFCSVYHSLAYCYQHAIKELEDITNKSFNKIYILGGGAKNTYLNKLIHQYTGKEVIALPIEATALGNIKIQMKVSQNNEKRS